MATAAEFYDGLVGEYDVLFEDWWKAAEWHADVISQVLAAQGVVAPARLLDCTCGIGTQALPLAARGFAVTGTDISSGAIARARSEVAARELEVGLAVADIRDVRRAVEGAFDIVISCDNALPHLLTDDDLGVALRSVRSCLRDGGLFLASIRDYDALAQERAPGVPIALHGEPGSRRGAGQSWSWTNEGDYVDITLFSLSETRAGWETSAHETRYRALRREDLSKALVASGFADVQWLLPRVSGYYQPMVLATASC